MRLTALMISCAMPAMAQDFQLDLPIDCALGETCYIQNYVDHDPSEAASDFQCGALTYDTHKGTDFGLHSLADMDAGVDVLASASGTVRSVRNDMRDIIYTPDLDGEINGRDCGNGVVIAHGDGWETQYCHMKEGSVVVQTGDFVNTGDILGEVGLSGRTQFPHVHISVRRDGNVVDPFDPDGQITCGEPSDTSLWHVPLDTPPGGLITTGFSDRVPEYLDVKAGTAAAPELSANAPIVLWAFAFGAQPGDVLHIAIDGPDGPLFETDDVLDRQQALFMRAGGLNAPDAGWQSGLYDGVVIHSRNGIELDRQTATVTLP
ncbi:M23 family metallopeptidase [Octadecabacter sp. 1_MG-2023]|nr:M23 family metallopeptidase [Octadecabacter sp. 1_MG-2023]MBU2991907.1 M23 family metallopeptidase [Octadecabacter sp. B2R22]MDO6735881.1 M23 family metallopeptidase [Octadecabacter sp. 1_MG-2023]